MSKFKHENKKITEWINKGEFDKAKNLARKLLEKAKCSGNNISIAYQFKKLGNVLSHAGDYQAAYKY